MVTWPTTTTDELHRPKDELQEMYRLSVEQNEVRGRLAEFL